MKAASKGSRKGSTELKQFERAVVGFMRKMTRRGRWATYMFAEQLAQRGRTQ